MEHATHTPGPWGDVQPGNGSTDRDEPGCRWIIHDGRIVAKTCQQADESTANARLIAAAPELLKACEAARRNIDVSTIRPGKKNTQRWETVIDTLDQAIRKSKGEA